MIRVDLPDTAVAELVERVTAAVLAELAEQGIGTVSPFLTVPEAADLLRCRRQRIDHLLSAGTLTRIKDGSRTLVSRAEILAHLRSEPTGPLAHRLPHHAQTGSRTGVMG